MTEPSTLERTRITRWFHALSDETRLDIVSRLAGGEQCVCDLQSALDAAQSRLSFHLKTLKTAGIVSDRREGRWIYYSLNPDVLEQMAGLIRELSSHEATIPGGGACCD